MKSNIIVTYIRTDKFEEISIQLRRIKISVVIRKEVSPLKIVYEDLLNWRHYFVCLNFT